jgi:hypothetical protein
MGFMHWFERRKQKKKLLRQNAQHTLQDLDAALASLDRAHAKPSTHSSTESKLAYDATANEDAKEAADLAWIKYWNRRRLS